MSYVIIFRKAKLMSKLRFEPETFWSQALWQSCVGTVQSPILCRCNDEGLLGWTVWLLQLGKQPKFHIGKNSKWQNRASEQKTVNYLSKLFLLQKKNHLSKMIATPAEKEYIVILKACSETYRGPFLALLLLKSIIVSGSGTNLVNFCFPLCEFCSPLIINWPVSEISWSEESFPAWI